MNDPIIAGLDIGTTKISVVILQRNELGKPLIKGIGISKSYGLKNGLIMNIDIMLESISKAIEQAQKMSGLIIDELYCNVSGQHVFSENSKGVIAISNDSNEVTHQELYKVLNAAESINFSKDRKVVHNLPWQFIIDGQDGIKDPIGISGSRLEVESHIVAASSIALQNITKTVNLSGFNVSGFVLSSLASMTSLLYNNYRDIGYLIIDIGGGTTDVVLSVAGSIKYSKIYPFGGNNVSSDISLCFKVPELVSEKLKVQYGCCVIELASDIDCVINDENLLSKGQFRVSQVELCEVIIPRVEELLVIIYDDLQKSGNFRYVTGGILLTGGGSLLKGIENITGKIFDLPVSICKPYGMDNFIDEQYSVSLYSTSIGLALYGFTDFKLNNYNRFINNKGNILLNMKHVFVNFIKDLFS